MKVYELIQKHCEKPLRDCTNNEICDALIKTVHDITASVCHSEPKKKLYYISAEFLIGKLLINNLINLGIYDEVKDILSKAGKDIGEIEMSEPEASLGNGGLGRLAACFLDSVASSGLCGDGIGLNYHFGLFRQEFAARQQTEKPDPWIKPNGFLKKTDVSYKIDFGNLSVTSRMYEIDVTGYSGRVNKLRLFDAESVDESIVKSGITFDKTDINKNITLFLYPDDSDEAGRLLRIYQQYFMVSNAARLILEECVQKGSKLYDLPDYAVIQINDTHPSMIIPELIRLLCEKGINMDDAIGIVSKTCAYTNHTILSEALEKWPMEYLEKAVPCIVPIIEELDRQVREKYKNPAVYVIDSENRVHMAHMDIHYSFSTNGVAHLHTEILKNNELKDFYEIYPEKFNNKTNGITPRRWLFKCNPALTEFIEELIGDGFRKDLSKLSDLKSFANDRVVLEKLLDIKTHNKKKLIKHLCGITDEQPVFDMQIKRLHEYKRQQMNLMYLIDKFLEIKDGIFPPYPITAIFGAKAAPAYVTAKDIIHLILCLQELIKNDAAVSKHLNVIMVENYNVTWAERLIPACDISEQISLASKEASGTGNMKFMLNGAVTLGTEDGANVEIHNLVGNDNIYIFGDDSKTVIKRYENGDYNPYQYYENNSRIKRAVDFITGPRMNSAGNNLILKRIRDELVNKDWFMTFPDFESYRKTKDRMLSDYTDRLSWAKKALINISCAGYFSSDRTIEEYNKDIWRLT